MNFIRSLLITIILSSSLIACNKITATNEPPTEIIQKNQENGYPLRDEDPSEDNAYPIEKARYGYENPGPNFFIEEPVQGGDTEVRGTGPKNIPIVLVDVSEVGKILSKTTINQNGQFVFSLSTPLETGHLIGIQLGDISNTDLSEEDFYYNENYYDRPFVGILFDMVSVE